MLDDDDVEMVALAINPQGCAGFVVLMLVLALMSYFVHQNKSECAEKHCAHGTSQLMDHRCVCVEEPK